VTEISANHFRAHLKKWVDACTANHDVLIVKRKRGLAFVVLSADDWKAIEETLFLNRIPGFVKSIHRAAKEPLSQGTRLETIKW
jgi:prevent-host-death family protein